MPKHSALLPALATFLRPLLPTFTKGPSVLQGRPLKPPIQPGPQTGTGAYLSPEARAWRRCFLPQADSVEPFVKPYNGPAPLRSSGQLLQPGQVKVHVSFTGLVNYLSLLV
jgi:hypothetical protein